MNLTMLSLLAGLCGGSLDTVAVLPAGSRLEVPDANVALTIRPGVAGEVGVRGRLPAGVCFEAEQVAGVLTVRLRRDRSRPAERATLELRVPREIDLVVHVATGMVRLDGLRGAIEVTTLSAPIVAADLDGEIVLRSVEAAVRGTDLRGSVRLRSTADSVVGTGLA
ncbi:MAG: hypothetical protein KC544_15475, partial [Gemmatimonadetes bacterium]|nr:hypothetical protein [Gemmatimonadota bacterium]